jgi:hypothetical protein
MNMKKYRGKIITAVILVLVFAAIWIAAVLISPARADDTMYPASKLPFAVAFTNPYVVVIDFDPTSATCGMVFDKSTGIAADGETWEANALTVGAGIAQDDDSDIWVATLPTLPEKRRMVVVIADNASPVETDLNVSGTIKLYFSPVTKQGWSTEFPSGRGMIYTGKP